MVEQILPKILLLDDEKFLLRMYEIALQKHKFEVSTFVDADAALASLRSGYTPNVILFDISMPDSKSGYEFIDAIHKEGLAPNALKIALTNQGQDGVIERVRQLGADQHFLKVKYLPGELAEKIQDMLPRS